MVAEATDAEGVVWHEPAVVAVVVLWHEPLVVAVVEEEC